MKNLKLFGYALVTVLFLALYSCGGGAKTEVKEVVEEAPAIEAAADTVAVDDTAAVVEEPEVMEAE